MPSRKNLARMTCPDGMTRVEGICVPYNQAAGYRNGGTVQFTGEGHVPYYTNTVVADTVPAMLTEGEFVLTKEATEKYGTDFLHRLNQGLVDSSIKRMNSGGMVSTNYQNGGSVMNEISGQTTHVAGHVHSFTIHSDQTVTIHEAVHPEEPNIRHGHQYIGLWPNGRVTENQSQCYPNCEQQYGVRGAPPHSHLITLTEQINGYQHGGVVNNQSNRRNDMATGRINPANPTLQQCRQNGWDIRHLGQNMCYKYQAGQAGARSARPQGGRAVQRGTAGAGGVTTSVGRRRGAVTGGMGAANNRRSPGRTASGMGGATGYRRGGKVTRARRAAASRRVRRGPSRRRR